MQEIWIVLDETGIVHDSGDYDAALDEYEKTEDFDGDLIFCQVISRRR